jgi:hypothetical protein
MGTFPQVLMPCIEGNLNGAESSFSLELSVSSKKSKLLEDKFPRVHADMLVSVLSLRVLGCDATRA